MGTRGIAYGVYICYMRTCLCVICVEMRVGVLVSDKKWDLLFSRGIFNLRESGRIEYVRYVAGELYDLILSKLIDESVFCQNVGDGELHVCEPLVQEIFRNRIETIQICAKVVSVPNTRLACDSSTHNVSCTDTHNSSCTDPSTHQRSFTDASTHNTSCTDDSTHSTSTPFIMKPNVACGTSYSHFVKIGENSADIQQYTESLSAQFRRDVCPFIIQEFIPNEGSFYKVYMLGEMHVFVFRRLWNAQADTHLQDAHVHTDTHVQEAHVHTETHVQDTHVQDAHVHADTDVQVDTDIVTMCKKMIRQCSSVFHTELFGIDIVQHSVTGKLYVVDANYFPSYTELGDFGNLLDEYLLGCKN